MGALADSVGYLVEANAVGLARSSLQVGVQAALPWWLGWFPLSVVAGWLFQSAAAEAVVDLAEGSEFEFPARAYRLMAYMRTASDAASWVPFGSPWYGAAQSFMRAVSTDPQFYQEA